MDKFDLNDLLRYSVIGLFFVLLNYLFIKTSFVEAQLALFEKSGGIAPLLYGVVLTSGTVIYIIHRSFTYPMVINPLVTKLTHKDRKDSLPIFSEQDSVWRIIVTMDAKRWQMASEVRAKLLEWATQAHFLYNLAGACFLVLLLNTFMPSVYLGSGGVVLLLAGFLFLAIAVLHHVRYKYFETEMVRNSMLPEAGKSDPSGPPPSTPPAVPVAPVVTSTAPPASPAK